VLLHFQDYLKAGYYPYRLEIKEQTIYEQSVINAMQKAIYEDISLTHGLRTLQQGISLYHSQLKHSYESLSNRIIR
jgi:hypothetical protein